MDDHPGSSNCPSVARISEYDVMEKLVRSAVLQSPRLRMRKRVEAQEKQTENQENGRRRSVVGRSRALLHEGLQNNAIPPQEVESGQVKKIISEESPAD